MLGAGSSRQLLVQTPLAHETAEITTVDIVASHNPDVLWDLEVTPWPFKDDSFEEIHAYEVLEHLGHQGNAREFFSHFGEIYRILKPGGILAGSVPQWDSMWAWGDPSHTRVICEGSFAFLDQTEYTKQVGKTPMSDFRSIWKGDLQIDNLQKMGGRLFFYGQAHKPARA